jgi:hypothetical protein
MGILDCRDPTLAAHKFMGILNEFSLWPWMLGRNRIPVSGKDVIEKKIRMYLSYYR